MTCCAGPPVCQIIQTSRLAQEDTLQAIETAIESLALAGLATEATLQAVDAVLDTINGKLTTCNTGAVTVAASALPAGAATEATLSTIDGKVTTCNTGAVTVAASALPAGAATESTLGSLDGKIDKDPVDGIVTIDLGHHEVHEGEHYYVTDVANNIQIITPHYWSIIAPNSAVRVHFVIGELFSSGGATWELFRSPTITVAGADITEHNSDDNSANVTTVIVRDGPTVTADGTLLLQTRTGSGTNASNRTASSRREAEEIILRQGTTYALKCTVDGNGTNAAIRLTWYEA